MFLTTFNLQLLYCSKSANSSRLSIVSSKSSGSILGKTIVIPPFRNESGGSYHGVGSTSSSHESVKNSLSGGAMRSNSTPPTHSLQPWCQQLWLQQHWLQDSNFNTLTSTRTSTLSLQHSHFNTLTSTLYLQHSHFSTLPSTLSLQHSNFNTLTSTLSLQHSNVNTLTSTLALTL